MAKGLKDDKGKLRFDLVPPIILKALAQVFTFGAKKYEDNSWQELEDFEDRYMAAAHRHLSDHQLGELRDEESGLYHLDHVLWNIAALRWKLEQEKEVDQVATIEFIFNDDFEEMDQENIRKFFEWHQSHLTFACTPEGIPKDEEGFLTVHDDVETET